MIGRVIGITKWPSTRQRAVSAVGPHRRERAQVCAGTWREQLLQGRSHPPQTGQVGASIFHFMLFWLCKMASTSFIVKSKSLEILPVWENKGFASHTSADSQLLRPARLCWYSGVWTRCRDRYIAPTPSGGQNIVHRPWPLRWELEWLSLSPPGPGQGRQLVTVWDGHTKAHGSREPAAAGALGRWSLCGKTGARGHCPSALVSGD